ncbi:MAG: DUF1330 domain-containing protein [Alphaproteobacteria bacterium]|jgi:uncharacterized protein (DUF1330 family)|nr:DUF1330 domain-containing protein [Alphaproteobacteria bacterium]
MTTYMIAAIDVHDGEKYETYKTLAPPLIEKHGGRYIVRGGERDVVEGTWPAGRAVVLEFPDWDSANAFVDDPDYAPIAAIRHATTTSHIWLVEGPEGGGNADGQQGYLLAEIHMTDADKYAPYAAQAPGALAPFNGTYLARGGRTRSVEGGMDLDRLVIVAFSDTAQAYGFHGSECYAPLIKIRQSASKSNVMIVAGL